MHASFGPLFNPKLEGDAKTAAVDKLKSKFKFLSEVELAGDKAFLLGGSSPTVADIYLLIVLNWLGYVGQAPLLAEYPALAAFAQRVAALPFVKDAQAAMAAESPAPAAAAATA